MFLSLVQLQDSNSPVEQVLRAGCCGFLIRPADLELATECKARCFVGKTNSCEKGRQDLHDPHEQTPGEGDKSGQCEGLAPIRYCQHL